MVSETQSPADWMPADKPTELSRIKLKTWTRQPVPMISKHSAHLTSLPFGIRTWLWRYTYLLLLISMLWHRQAIFESKGYKLSSSAECRIRTQRVSETPSPSDWMPADKPTELSMIKLKTWTRQAHGCFYVECWNNKHIILHIQSNRVLITGTHQGMSSMAGDMFLR